MSNSRTDSMIKITILALVCLLAFTVGAFVGKQFSDSQYKYAQLQAKANGGDRQISSTELMDEEEDETEIVDARRAEVDTVMPKISDANLEELINEAATRAPAKAEVAEVPKATTASTTKTLAVTKSADSAAAIEVAQPKELPSTVAASSIGKFTIQVASYATETEAIKHATDLKDKGFSAFYVPAKVNDRNWYRVSVGLFGNRQEAMEYRKELMTEANISSAIVQKIIQ